MKKIWSKSGRNRSRGDDTSVARSDHDLATSVHVRSLIVPDYDAKTVKHAWVNAVLNALAREFSEQQLKLYRLELRGSHLHFYRPPTLVDARQFRLDTFDEINEPGASSSSSYRKMNDFSSNKSTMGASSVALFTGNTSIISSPSLIDFSSRVSESGGSLCTQLGSVSDNRMASKTQGTDSSKEQIEITYYATAVPHPELQFDFILKKFLANSPPEALIHFFLFADAKAMEEPLCSLLCVIPMMEELVLLLRYLHMYMVAIYDGKFGTLISTFEPTRRVVQLFGHINTNFGGYFLKADTSSCLLKCFDTLARSAPLDMTEQISKVKIDILRRQEQILALVSNQASNPLPPAEDPFFDLSSSIFVNNIGLFDFVEAVTDIDLSFFRSWNCSVDKSLLLSSPVAGHTQGDVLYKRNPLVFNNSTHTHYLSRLLVYHLFLENNATSPITSVWRARVLEKWIDIGCLLDKLGNMSLWLGIASVILLQPVLRLTSVWQHVSEDYVLLIRSDWSLLLFELDRRHLATSFELVTFGSSSGTDLQATFKDSFHIMAPRGLGKIYSKSRIVPYYSDLQINNKARTLVEELEAIWKKIEYSSDRWNEYLDLLQDLADLIAINQEILHRYDANGLLFSNQSLNQVLCLGSKKNKTVSLPLTLKNRERIIDLTKARAANLSAKLRSLLSFNCDSINLDTIMTYSLQLEASPPENYLRPESESQARLGSFVGTSRLSGTKAEDCVPLFQLHAFKFDFAKYDSAVAIPVDSSLTLQKSGFQIDLADCGIDELEKMREVLSDEECDGLDTDVDNILSSEKFKEFSLEDFSEVREEERLISAQSQQPDSDSNNILHSQSSQSLVNSQSLLNSKSLLGKGGKYWGSLKADEPNDGEFSVFSEMSYFPKTASIDRLIDLLIIDPKYFHNTFVVNATDYRTVFIMSYSTFITTKDLLQLLAHRFVRSGNAVISVMKKQYLIQNNYFDDRTFGAYPNWEFDKDVDLSVLGKVDYQLLLQIQTNILKVLIVLVSNFFSSFLNNLANKRVMINLLKLYSNEILQWYNSSKIDLTLDGPFENLVAYYKRLKKLFIMKIYRPCLPPQNDEALLDRYRFSNTLTEVPVNRNLPSHKNIHKIEKFLNKFNELVATFYCRVLPHHWFAVFKLFEAAAESNSLLNYPIQSYSVSEDVVLVSNTYDYLLSVRDRNNNLIFTQLPPVLQTLLSLFGKFKSYLLIQLCDPGISDDERLDRMRTVLIMARISGVKMASLSFALDGDSAPVPSFIGSVIANAIYSPASRFFAKLWVRALVTISNGSLNLVDADSSAAIKAQKIFDSLEALLPTDITAADLSSSDPLLPCVGWIVENMIDLAVRPSLNNQLVNFSKRLVLFDFIREVVADGPHEQEMPPESKEFDFLFLLDDNLPHISAVSYDINEHCPRGFFEKIFKKQYAIIAFEARCTASSPKTTGVPMTGPKTLSKKISNSGLRRQSLNFKTGATLKFRLGGLFNKPKAFGSERVVAVRELPDCLLVADAKQKPALVIPLKDRKIFPVYVLPACFKIDIDNSSEVCFVQASSESDAQDWLWKLNYANRHWFQSRALNTKLSHTYTTFGVPLEFVCERDKALVPAVLVTIFELLEKEGLSDVGVYRVGTSISELASLKQEIDRTGTVTVLEHAVDVHALTSCVKLFFRELPDALLTDSVIESLRPFKRATRTSGGLTTAEINAFKTLMANLPQINYSTLKALIGHLNKVYNHRDQNKMTLANLATVIGPALTEASNVNSLINNFGLMNYVLEKLIENYEQIFR